MEISGINAAGNMPGGQMAKPPAADSASKRIQNEIANVQRQMQQLSSKHDMPVEEKMKKRQEYQQQLSSLNARLRQQQADAGREQRKKALAAEMQDKEEQTQKTSERERQTDRTQDDRKQTGKSQNQETPQRMSDDSDTQSGKETDSILSHKGMRAMIAADSSTEQVRQQGTVIARIEGGMVILKGEIRQDEARNENTESKEEELNEQEKRIQQAETVGDFVSGQQDAADKALIQAVNFTKENNLEAQQQFFAASGAGAYE